LSYIKEQKGAKAGFDLIKYADHRMLIRTATKTVARKIWEKKPTASFCMANMRNLCVCVCVCVCVCSLAPKDGVKS
jgi:hypothetical protein